VAELEGENGLTHIVLDDIYLPADSRPLERPLVRIKTILDDRRGRLLLTSTVVLPQRLSLALGLPASATMPIPPFSRQEITQFLIARGCPATHIADWWAAFIEIHTSGHAQLVHARVAALEAQAFPVPDIQSAITTPSDVVEARTEARRLIMELDAPTRDLIYRLSLTVQALSRRQLFAIAAQQPPISEPGLALDKLVGPWLEIVIEGLYRVSPLLRGIGHDVQGEAWAATMHSGIAHALLSFRTVSPEDVSTILLHAMAARDWSIIARLAYGIFNSDSETWEALAQSASWFVLVGTGNALRPDADEFSLFLIRLLQFQLAAAGKDASGAASIIACVDKELPAAVQDMPLRLARHYFLASVLLRSEVNLPMPQLISIGLEYIRLCDELKDELAKISDPEFTRVMAGPDGEHDLASIAGFTLAVRVVDRNDLAALLDACEPVEASLARRLLWFSGGRESTAQLIFDRVWLTESGSATPDWQACRSVFKRTYSFARRTALTGWAQGAARAIARMIDENFSNSSEALRLLDTFEAETGRSPGQEDQRATILLRKGDTGDALAIWRELLPRWTPQDEFDLQQTFSHRLAAVAAERLSQWQEAAHWLRTARELANGDTQAIYVAALLVDEGFAHWKARDTRQALDCLVDGLTAIDQLPPDNIDEGAYLLRKRAGHTLMWIANVEAGRPPKDFSEPPPACCSSLDPAPVNEARAPSTPSDAMWEHIVSFEFAANLGDEQFCALEGRLKASPYGLIRFDFDSRRLEYRLRKLVLDDFEEVIADWVDSFALCRTYYHREGGLGPADPLPADAMPPDRQQSAADLVLSAMLNALIALAARATVMKEMLDYWATGAAEAGLSSVIGPWLDFVSALFVDQTVNGEAAVRDQSQPWTWQMAASIRVALDPATRPAELLTMHHYWTNVLPKIANVFFVMPDIEQLVTTAWRRLAEQSFPLRAPAVTAPALLQACASTATAWQKIGEVLIAACDAVPAPVPSEFRERFRLLRDDKS
jgi:tetratricopeptide (TPR) repeat protein